MDAYQEHQPCGYCIYVVGASGGENMRKRSQLCTMAQAQWGNRIPSIDHRARRTGQICGTILKADRDRAPPPSDVLGPDWVPALALQGSPRPCAARAQTQELFAILRSVHLYPQESYQGVVLSTPGSADQHACHVLYE